MGEHLKYNTGGHLQYSTGGHLKYKTAFTPGTDCSSCGSSGNTPHAIDIDLRDIFPSAGGSFTIHCAGVNDYTFNFTPVQSIPQKSGTPCRWEKTLTGAGTLVSGGGAPITVDLHIQINRVGAAWSGFVDTNFNVFFQESGLTVTSGDCITAFALRNNAGGTCSGMNTSLNLNCVPN